MIGLGVVIGVGCFFGGSIVTAGVMGVYNYFKEQREMRRRSDALYEEYQRNL